jgi:hypothetical protein
VRDTSTTFGIKIQTARTSWSGFQADSTFILHVPTTSKLYHCGLYRSLFLVKKTKNLSDPCTGPDTSRRLRLPDFKTISM